MKVQCGQCPAKYAVADERVRDKKVRIRCRRCNAAIVVDGKVSPPLVTSTPARRSARPSSSNPPDPRDGVLPEVPESLPPPSNHESDWSAPRPVAHTMMGGLEAPIARQLVTDHVVESQALAQARSGTLKGTGEQRPGMPDAHRGFTEPPMRGEVERWRVALTQQDLRWMTTEEIAQAFRDGAIKSETFVFRAGMPTWVTLLEVSEIAQALSDAQLLGLEPYEASDGEAHPSTPPQRISSLPPPRKSPRGRAGQDPAAAAGEAASDSEESLPFNLVTGRGNGSDEPNGLADVLEPKADEAAPPEPEPEPLAAEAAPVANGEAAAAPDAAAAPAPAAAPAAPATAQRSSTWIWVLLALLVLGAAAYVLGPRLGLQLH
jgi:predicted Zn finger-like uncharacterized protein